MATTVISVEDVKKQYRLGLIGGATFREELSRWWAKKAGRQDPYAKLGGGAPVEQGSEILWALKGVSFEVSQGEILGIIGRNGAGKSTLLKILSRITAPTSGRIRIRGRVGSLLEVGTGFHPELTGRENIYLNGAILGMTRAEVSRKLDSIVEFAEMGPFIETPTKRYSSGMTVRLAFSVAAHLDPEILVIDEVLAVGDAAFQRKCLGKMQDVANSGRTVLFVSHNMAMVDRLCARVVALRKGTVYADGLAEEVIADYLSSDARGEGQGAELNPAGRFIDRVRLEDESGKVTNLVPFDTTLAIKLDYKDLASTSTHVFAVRISTQEGVDIFTSWDTDSKIEGRPGDGCAVCRLPARLLKPGSYILTIMLHEVSHSRIQAQEEVKTSFEVTEVGCPFRSGRVGLIAPHAMWRYEVQADAQR